MLAFQHVTLGNQLTEFGNVIFKHISQTREQKNVCLEYKSRLHNITWYLLHLRAQKTWVQTKIELLWDEDYAEKHQFPQIKVRSLFYLLGRGGVEDFCFVMINYYYYIMISPHWELINTSCFVDLNWSPFRYLLPPLKTIWSLPRVFSASLPSSQAMNNEWSFIWWN